MRPIRSLLILLVAAPLAAQTALVSEATVRSSAGGAVVAVLKEGTTVTVASVRSGNAYITFSGWIDGSKLGAPKDSFPVHLMGNIAMRLRSAPSMSGVILGEVRAGTGLFNGGKQASWVNVHRGGWVDVKVLPKDAVAGAPAAASKPTATAKAPAKNTVATKSAPTAKPTAAKPAPVIAKLAPPKTAAPPTQKTQAPPAAAEPAPTVESMPDGAMRVARSTMLRTGPNGAIIGQIGPGTIVEPLARSRGWVRVRATVWLPERDVVPADSSFGASLSAADLRSDPEGTRGKTVRWEVQVLALQYADPLRRDLAQDEPYFLAKGPGTEDQLLYLAIPPSLLGEARSTQALSRLLVTARVRTGRSQPVGIPILDILAMSRQ